MTRRTTTAVVVTGAGGVGKTTTVVSLASYLALDGHRVLLVDMDPQGNATSGLGIDRTALSRGMQGLLIRIAKRLNRTGVIDISSV